MVCHQYPGLKTPGYVTASDKSDFGGVSEVKSPIHRAQFCSGVIYRPVMAANVNPFYYPFNFLMFIMPVRTGMMNTAPKLNRTLRLRTHQRIRRVGRRGMINGQLATINGQWEIGTTDCADCTDFGA